MIDLVRTARTCSNPEYADSDTNQDDPDAYGDEILSTLEQWDEYLRLEAPKFGGLKP